MRALLVALIACLLLDACALRHRLHRHAVTSTSIAAPTLPQLATHEVPAAFVGEPQPIHDLDSIASWLAPGGASWVIATASKSDQLAVFDGDSGKRLRAVGTSGSGAGQFRHPAGIVAFADLLFVVERDNHRVQVLQLPDFKPLGSFGGDQLHNPVALWLHETAPEEYEVLVTDQSPAIPSTAHPRIESGAGSEPVEGSNHNQQNAPLPQSGLQIKRYRVHTDDGVLHADYVAAFGDITVPGALRSVESIVGDDDNGRLAIATEPGNTGARVRVYGMDGRYTGKNLGAEQFRTHAGGMALFACADGSGYWIGVDREATRSAFLLFDRKTLAYLGAFTGNGVADTSGIVLQPASTTRFPNGALYAVSNGASIAAFDWREVERALQLKPDCGP